MPTEFVMLPPQTERTREWGARLAAAVPELKIVVAENHTHAAQVIAHADAAFGTSGWERRRAVEWGIGKGWEREISEI